MPSTQQLKEMIDLHDLAGKLGLERPGGKGNYRSPHHDDKTPSLSVTKDGKRFTDYSSNDPHASGSCIDLVMHVMDLDDVGDAMRHIHELYGLDPDLPNEPKRPRTLVEIISDNAMKDPARCMDYLVEQRCISRKVVERCIARRTLGFNEYENPKHKSGDVGFGGAGVAFIGRDLQTNMVTTVETRYINPELNGGVKSNCQGEKQGQFYIPDPVKLKSDKTRTVVIVESAINALTVEAFGGEGYTGIATLGSNNQGHDWSFLRGKIVLLCMDNDSPQERDGSRPGQEAAWRIHEELTAVGIPCLMIDQQEWEGINDINDYACEKDKDCKELYRSATRVALKKLEEHLIPGLAGKDPDGTEWYRRRLTLPTHDYKVYWQYRVKWDYTSFIKVKPDGDGGEMKIPEDVCGFRIAALSKVNISSAISTMTGEQDLQPNCVFASSVQLPRHSHLVRRVMNDESLHNLDQWRKFGAILKPAHFARMLMIWERATHIGGRDAVNFVGLCWRNGKPQLNEGSDCFFTEPDKQCPYHNMAFPSGAKADARKVIAAYQETFTQNAAAMLLVWAIGAQLKAFLGFWPHFTLQAEKGSGKSVLTNRLSRTLGLTMFSGQSLQTEFRLLTSVSHTSHPIGWEELSARKQDVIDKAVSILQESYAYTVTRRGGDMTEYLISAPVLLAGEDVPVQSLLQKLVRTDISGKQGAMLPENLPRFPMRQWIQYLAKLDKQYVLDRFNGLEKKSRHRSAAKNGDNGAARIIRNYAAVQLSWVLLCDFAGIDARTGDFPENCVREMNDHIHQTESDREPWVWIMDIILGEIDRGNYNSPYKFEVYDGIDCLVIRMPHIMQHLSQTPALREKFNSLPVKQHSVLKKQLQRAGVIAADDIERSIRKSRVAHCTLLSIPALNQYGLHPAVPDDPTEVY